MVVWGLLFGKDSFVDGYRVVEGEIGVWLRNGKLKGGVIWRRDVMLKRVEFVVLSEQKWVQKELEKGKWSLSWRCELYGEGEIWGSNVRERERDKEEFLGQVIDEVVEEGRWVWTQMV